MNPSPPARRAPITSASGARWPAKRQPRRDRQRGRARRQASSPRRSAMPRPPASRFALAGLLCADAATYINGQVIGISDSRG